MTPDSQTNFLYLADTLPKKYPEFFTRFEKALREQQIAFDFLPCTKDVWAVDYMPIQVGEKFVQFSYDPSYLKFKKYEKTKSDVDAICAGLGIQVQKSEIVLDGGNLIRSAHQAFVTDRIFEDNADWGRNDLLDELQRVLELDRLFLLPVQPGDFTGHADGMVRFVDEQTVLANDYSKEPKKFYEAFEIALHNTGLKVVKLPYNVYCNSSNDHANGDYINFLQMEKVIFVPVFGLDENDEVLRILNQVFPNQSIVPIESNDLARNGGILNCISWNIRQ